MIFGSVSYSQTGSSSFYYKHCKSITGELFSSFPVNACGFSGGFYLNSRLPYTIDNRCFQDPANDITVLMYGCFYNRCELLEASGVDKQSSDPEIAAELFKKAGPDFVKKINGDFVIFIFQSALKQAYLFRDHLGIEPVAWTVDAGNLYFSSDIIGLCSLLSGEQGIDSEYMMGYFKYIDYRKTPNMIVKKLLPGHWLRFDDKGLEIHKYWDPKRLKPDNRISFEMMITDLGELLRDAVRIRSDPRFNVGAHVSSGLDSGIVSVMARKEFLHQEKFFGFSLSPLSFDAVEMKYDERILVEKICTFAGIMPVFSELDSEDLHRYTSHYFLNQGYFSDNKILEQAGALNVNLIFSGWGGDEFISTGSRSIDADLFFGLNFRKFLKRHPVTKFRKLLRVIIYGILYPSLGILGKEISESLRDDARYLAREYKKSDRDAVRNYFLHASRKDHHLGMLRFYHLQERCEAWAVSGWHNGVEYRYPLLDKRIVEYMLRVPSKLLCKTNEYRPLLRELGKGILPDEVRLNRSKADPVYLGFIGRIFEQAGSRLADETAVWRKNPDLNFFDFDLMENDIAKYKEQTDSVDVRLLFKAVVYIKALHEFTRQYHRREVQDQ